MRVPDFFVIGAPKCGTNALWKYLGEHPRVFMPKLKEPQYFCRDFPGLALIKNWDDYARLFAVAPAGTVLGEASVWYLYSKVAVPAIMAANQAAKLIVILRNPIDAAHALHTQLLRSLKEDNGDFDIAWKLQDERRDGRKLPRYCPEPQCVQYREVYSFGAQVLRLLDCVPVPQIKILIFEEFLADVRRGYRELLEFLGLEPDGREEFGMVNQSRMARSPTVTRVLAGVTAVLPGDLMVYRRVLRAVGIHPLRLLSRYNTVTTARPALRPEVRRAVARDLAADVRRLEFGPQSLPSVLDRLCPAVEFGDDRRTATGCSRARRPPRLWPRCWISRRFAACRLVQRCRRSNPWSLPAGLGRSTRRPAFGIAIDPRLETGQGSFADFLSESLH